MWSKSERKPQTPQGFFSYSSLLVTRPACANCISTPVPGNPDWRQKKKTHQDPLSVADKNHSLKIASRGEGASHAGSLLLRTEGLRVRWRIRWKRCFFTNQTRSTGQRKGLMLKTTKLFFMDNIAIKISFGQTTVFPPWLVWHRHYQVSKDLIRSAYLRDSWGAANVNMAIMSISYLHNTVCRLKAVKDTASRVF